MGSFLAAVVGADRFLAEIETTANLQDPHILPLFDSGEADGFLFYVMPYVEGESLREKLDREKQLSVGEAVRITSEVAEALEYGALTRITYLRSCHDRPAGFSPQKRRGAIVRLDPCLLDEVVWTRCGSTSRTTLVG